MPSLSYDEFSELLFSFIFKDAEKKKWKRGNKNKYNSLAFFCKTETKQKTKQKKKRKQTAICVGVCACVCVHVFYLWASLLLERKQPVALLLSSSLLLPYPFACKGYNAVAYIFTTLVAVVLFRHELPPLVFYFGFVKEKNKKQKKRIKTRNKK